MMKTIITDLASHLTYAREISQQHGPNPEQYETHLAWYNRIHSEIKSGRLQKQDRDQLRSILGEAYSLNSLQGFAYHKPHGYAGDFEIIEKIYTQHVSDDPRIKKYDLFFQAQSAPKAVRNRKAYFKSILKDKIGASTKPLKVLNLASGPCRGVAEFLKEYPESNFQIDCLEIDPKAIAHAKSLLTPHAMDRISLVQGNIFKFLPSDTYDLVWSAGLFDYLNDKAFINLLRRFSRAVSKGGEIIIGNFHPTNPTIPYMEAIAEWYLNHRDEDNLFELGRAAGASSQQQMTIDREAEGVNLFLRITY